MLKAAADGDREYSERNFGTGFVMPQGAYDHWVAMLASLPECPQVLGASPADPMDTPLPCDVTVGHGTHRKGTKLRSLVRRMELLFDIAHAGWRDITPEQQADNLARLRGEGPYSTQGERNE
jgi:hypothetical protein